MTQLCMVLIKVSDISNEARPMDVAEPWLDCLLQEFFEQSDREKMEGLPVTPFMDRDKITKPSSQCSFIGFVLLPLFESIGRLYPELDVRDQKGFYIRIIYIYIFFCWRYKERRFCSITKYSIYICIVHIEI